MTPDSLPTSSFALAASTAAIVLAAGRSSRMGRWKAALPWPGGPTLLQAHAATLAIAAGAGVLCAVAEERRGEMAALSNAEGPLAEGASVVWIPDSSAPNFRPVLLALAALRERSAGGLPEACWLTPVDAVPARRALLDAMLRAAEERPDALAIRPSAFDAALGRPRSGHPVLLRRDALEALSRLDPNEGRLDVYLRSMPAERQCFVEANDPLILANLNRPEEYEAALKRAEGV